MAADLHRALLLLRTPRYGALWTGNLLSSIGTWAQQLGQPWLLLGLGASPVVLGLDAFALSAPLWLTMPIGGALADCPGRRRSVVAALSVQLLCVIALVGLVATGRIRPWMAVVLSAIVGTTDGLSMPSLSTAVTDVVGRERLSTGLALNAVQYNVARLAGPVVAGTLLTADGPVGCFILSAASYVPLLAIAWWVLPRPDDAPGRASAIQKGVGGCWQDPQLLRMLRGPLAAVFLSGLLCAPLLAFASLFVRETLHGTASHLMAAVTAFGAGGLVGSAALLRVQHTNVARRLCARAATAYGAIVAVAALVQSTAALSAVLFLAGIATTLTNTPALTVVQAHAPVAVRGRAVTLFSLALRGGTALGSLLTGLSISAMGSRGALLASGVLAVALQLALTGRWLRSPYAVAAERGTANDGD